jgi:RimJ/RimL family protein N-acetyltransferase
MSYGIAPRWRGRGLASRAARLAGHWALRLPHVITVQLRIGQGHTASQHVAVNAGFVLAGTVTQVVTGTGETFEDLCYVLTRPGTGASGAASAAGSMMVAPRPIRPMNARTIMAIP